MRSLLTCTLLFAVLACPSLLHAQAAPLPPGTSAPDTGAAPAAPVSRAAALIAQAEDDIVRSQYAKALPLLNQAAAEKTATSQEAARAFYDRGYIEQAQQKLDAAKADFRKAIAADPNQFESHAGLGQLLAEQEKWNDARHELELASALQPASGNRVQAVANVYRTLAHVDAQLRQDAAAGDALLAALKLTPEQSDDTLLAAQLAEDEKNYADAAREYEKVLADDPKSIPAAEDLARTLIHESKFSEAESALRPALQQEPNSPVLLAESATALVGEGKTSDAIAQLETLHRQNPNQPAVTRMLADLYDSAGQATNAGPLYQQLLATDPRNPDLLTAAAENMMHQRRWSQAVRTFQQSLDIEARQPDAWSGLAFAASQDRQYQLVLTALDRRDQYLAESPATLFLRATALDNLHHTREAIPYYRKFLSTAQGKFPDEESQVRQRLTELRKSH